MNSEEIQENKLSATHGGSRKNSGRKRIYKGSYDSKRLKVSLKNAELAKAAVSIIENMDEGARMRLTPSPCMLDGSDPKEKGSGLKKWKDYDAIGLIFPLTLQGRKDLRLFALAWYLTKPCGVKLESLGHDDVWLRWNRIDEVIRLMGCYGMLLGKSKFPSLEKIVLDKIPFSSIPHDIAIWIKENI